MAGASSSAGASSTALHSSAPECKDPVRHSRCSCSFLNFAEPGAQHERQTYRLYASDALVSGELISGESTLPKPMLERESFMSLAGPALRSSPGSQSPCGVIGARARPSAETVSEDASDSTSSGECTHERRRITWLEKLMDSLQSAAPQRTEASLVQEFLDRTEGTLTFEGIDAGLEVAPADDLQAPNDVPPGIVEPANFKSRLDATLAWLHDLPPAQQFAAFRALTKTDGSEAVQQPHEPVASTTPPTAIPLWRAVQQSRSLSGTPPLSSPMGTWSTTSAPSPRKVALEEPVAAQLYWTDLFSWLRVHRLHKYADIFASFLQANVDRERMLHLSDANLETAGIAALGARRKILRLFERIAAETA